HTPVTGFDFYDGPQGVQRVTFINFRSNALRPAGALSYNPENNAPIDVRNAVAGLHFINANQVYLLTPSADRDGGKQAMIYDSDGSLTGATGQYVTAHSALLATGACTLRQEWNAFVCPLRYGNFSFDADSGERITPLTAERDDGAMITLTGQSDSYAETAAIPGQNYVIHFGDSAPHSLQIDLQHLRAGDTVQLQLTYPAHAALTVYRDAAHSYVVSAAKSLVEFRAGNGDKYYYDAASGTLYLLAVVRSGNDWTRINVEMG
ncbi:MAG: hypothetical protein J2P37_36010, partial [Ktedonobacteraceae bacterium]|nr:hypothetical protein [Ktedonobacteraceae bacterium]